MFIPLSIGVFMPLVITMVGLLLFLILFFILIRELVCWYFKINQRIKLLEEIKKELQNKNDWSL